MKDFWQHILDHPRGADVRWLLRVVEARYRHQPRLGDARSTGKEAVRLDQPPTLAFPDSNVAEIRAKGAYYRVLTHAFGLWGANGVAPHEWTEEVYRREHYSADPTLARFVGMFHHRMICLFYKAWARCDQATDFDRPEEQRFLGYTRTLGGVNFERLTREAEGLPEYGRAFFVGLLGRMGRDPGALGALLSDFFRLPVEVEEFVAQWIRMPAEQMAPLGQPGNRLGEMTLVGEQFLSCDMKYRIRIGPLTREQFDRFVLDKDRLRLLRRWLSAAVGEELIWDVQMLLRAEDAGCSQLGGNTALGRNAWTFAQPLSGVLEDAILPPSIFN